MSRPDLARRRTIIAVLCLAVVAGGVLAGPSALRRMSSSLSVLGLGKLAYGYDYTVEFEHAAGLRPGAQVRISGIKVGIVRGLELGEGRIRAEVVLNQDVRLGEQSVAFIRMASVLGQQYVAIEPRGDGRLEEGATIPLARTTVPFTLSELATETTQRLGRIDTGQLRTVLDTLTGTLRDTDDVGSVAIRQLGRMAAAVAARDDQLRLLLDQTRDATDLLNDQRDEMFDLMGKADVVLGVLQARRGLIHDLLVDTRELATQLNGLIRDNQARLSPMMRNLRTVLKTLLDNERDLNTMLSRLADSGRYFANFTGSGPFASVYVPYLVMPDQGMCALGLAGGTCR